MAWHQAETDYLNFVQQHGNKTVIYMRCMDNLYRYNVQTVNKKVLVSLYLLTFLSLCNYMLKNKKNSIAFASAKN